MATYTVRGNSHNVVYTYFDELGHRKQIWETYMTEVEALKRKAYIDSLQKNQLRAEVTKEALEYRRRSMIAKAVSEQMKPENPVPMPQGVRNADNTQKTYREFAEKWLPFHVRKKRLSPNTYDSYRQNLENHILPYFGDRIMSQITSEDVDDFLDALSRKPCKGPKGYGKAPGTAPTLSSSSIKKCYIVLTAGFPTALKWGYIQRIPETTPPVEKTQKRRAWSPEQVSKILDSIKDDRLIHLAIHLGFVCSLREGEVAGIDVKTINLKEGSLWISRQVQRVSDDSIRELPKEELIEVFPKKVAGSKRMTMEAPRKQRKITVVDAQPPIYTQDDFDRAVAGIREKNESGWRCRADARHSSILETRKHIGDLQKMLTIEGLLDVICTRVIQLEQHLDNCIGEAQDMPTMEGMEMSKAKIDRRVRINDREMRIRANSEEEYVQKVLAAMGGTATTAQGNQSKHLFKEYAAYWFTTFSRATTAQATSITYERQLKRYLYPAFEGMYIEDITTADAQKLFNGMTGTKETKKKCKTVLNMVFELAIEENLIQKNPLKSRSFKIMGEASKPTEPYSVEEMRFLVTNIGRIKNPMDRAFLALQALHPLRPEETLGLRWKDVDFAAMKLHVNHSVTHPDRNQPVFKDTKTEGSNRVLDLVPQIVQYL